MRGVCFSKKQSVMETLQSQEAGMTVGLYWGTFLKSVSVCNIYQNNAPVLHHDIVLGLIQFHRFPLVTLVCLCVCVWGKVSSSPLLTEGQPRVWFLQLHPECVCVFKALAPDWALSRNPISTSISDRFQIYFCVCSLFKVTQLCVHEEDGSPLARFSLS